MTRESRSTRANYRFFGGKSTFFPATNSANPISSRPLFNSGHSLLRKDPRDLLYIIETDVGRIVRKINDSRMLGN
jgi:hypothetical protein